jgi:hypothetical protein
MKKELIACFCVIIMLMIPFTAAQKADISTIKNVTTNNDELPQIYITFEQLNTLNNFINATFEGEDLELARTIRDNIIQVDLEVDIVELADALITYTFQPIPEDELNSVMTIEELNQLIEQYWNIVDGEFIKGIFQQLVDKIIELIKDRLGWLNDLINKVYSLIVNGVELVVDIIQPGILALAVLVVAIINEIISAPKTFAEALRELFQQEYENFVAFMSSLIDQIDTIAQNLKTLINQIIDLMTNPKLQEFLTELTEFITWLECKPWEDPILVKGNIILNIFFPLADATITCRGQTGTTDGNGDFEFLVDPNPDEESFPQNEYYGMHNCAITVEKDGIVYKETSKVLSYCFSGGKIEWTFFLIKSRSRDTGFRTVLLERFNTLLERLQNLFLVLFRRISRIDIQIS